MLPRSRGVRCCATIRRAAWASRRARHLRPIKCIPRACRSLTIQTADHTFNNFHLRKDADIQIREDGVRFYTDSVNRRVYMDHVIFFTYLSDVKEGDGGLCVVPGSHHAHFKFPRQMFYGSGKDIEWRDPTVRKKLGFVQVTANAGDCIIMPNRLCHAVMPWLPRDRDRMVLFYTFIPQFYYSELPPTTITSKVMEKHAHHLDHDTVDLISNLDKSQIKDVVKKHLARTEDEAPPVPRYNPSHWS